MNTNEAIGLAARVIHSAVVERGQRPWLCGQNKTIVWFPDKEIPENAFKIFEFNLKMATSGLSSPEWTRLESKLKELTEGGLL